MIKPLDGSEPKETKHQISASSQLTQLKDTPTAAPSTVSLPKISTSIKEIIAEKPQVNDVPFHYTTQGTSPQNPPVVLTQAELLKCWHNYAALLSNNNNYLKQTLLTCNPNLKDDNTVEVSVYNPVQQEEINNCVPSLIAFLCKCLNKNSIAIHVTMVETEQKDIPYTATDKYEYLLKKNQALAKLREVFGLSPV